MSKLLKNSRLLSPAWPVKLTQITAHVSYCVTAAPVHYQQRHCMTPCAPASSQRQVHPLRAAAARTTFLMAGRACVAGALTDIRPFACLVTSVPVSLIPCNTNPCNTPGVWSFVRVTLDPCNKCPWWRRSQCQCAIHHHLHHVAAAHHRSKQTPSCRAGSRMVESDMYISRTFARP